MLSKNLFVTEKMSLMGFTSFGFAYTKIHDFQNTVFKSYWHCLYLSKVYETLGKLSDALYQARHYIIFVAFFFFFFFKEKCRHEFNTVF